MKVLEYEAKALLKNEGLSIPRGDIVSSPEGAAAMARVLGRPVVLKAQIPMSGRNKVGGVRFAETRADAASAADELLGCMIGNFQVDSVLVEEKLEVVEEVFIGSTYDTDIRRVVILTSMSGGVDVEVVADIVRRPISSHSLIPDYMGREVVSKMCIDRRQLLSLSEQINKVARCFVKWDALLLEINPLIMDVSGQWWVADVHLELDDDALYRQTELLDLLPKSVQLATSSSPFEQQAAEIDRADHRGVAGRLVAFDGNLGLLIGGGGASLTIFDAVLDADLKPANYCEIGGNPSVWKVKELTKLILKQPEVINLAIIMNVVNNTRVDLVARGVIKGILELGLDPKEVIVAFRIPGSWEDEGEAIMRHYSVPYFGRETSIDQVVEAIKCRS